MVHMIIVGAGECGTRAAFALRERGVTGRITLIGKEARLPYERPPLSKPAGDAVNFKPICSPEALQSDSIDYLQGVSVNSFDAMTKSIELSTGERLEYDKLLLATGSRPRLLDCPGADRLLYFRTYADADMIFMRTQPDVRVAIIGGGLIGMELAAVLRARGIVVNVIEAFPRPFGRAVPRAFAEALYERHLAEGVRFNLGSGVMEIDEQGVVLADGNRVPADLVVAAVGVLPNLELARDAGLKTGNGIVTDPYLRSSDPDIYAAGDCALVERPGSGHIRFESWRAARNQAEIAAHNMVGGAESFSAHSWFWSDQYDLGLQVVGFPQATHSVIRRPLPNGSIEFYLENGRLVAAAGLGTGAAVAKEIKLSEMLIELNVHPDPALLEDPDCNLKSLLRQTRAA